MPKPRGYYKPINHEWLTPREFAERYNIHANTVRKLCKEQLIDHVRLGKSYRIKVKNDGSNPVFDAYILAERKWGSAGELDLSELPRPGEGSEQSSES